MIKWMLVQAALTRMSTFPVSADHSHYRRPDNMAVSLTDRYDNNDLTKYDMDSFP